MSELRLEPGQMLLPKERVACMRDLLESMAGNDMSDVEELGRFIDLYNAHQVPEEDRLAFYASLDVPEHSIIFGDSTLDSIVEEYDALAGTPREQLPFGATAIPNELEVSLGRAYVAVATASEFLQPQENETLEPEILSRRDDIDAFAEKFDHYGPDIATRAWTALTRRFIVRVQPERFEEYPWYKREDYADFPDDLFAVYPPADEAIYDRGYSNNKVTNLRLHVLEDLLAKIEPTGSATAREVLGHGVGVKTLQFLKEFAESRRQESGPA